MQVYIERLRNKLDGVSICPSHDIEHMFEVMKHTKEAVKELDEPEHIKTSIVLAGLLHDIDDHKFFGTTDYSNAREILCDFEHADLVIEMISLVSCSANGDSMVSPEWKLIPRYCDRLEAIGSIGLKRVYQYTMTKNRPLHTSNTAVCTTIEQLCDVATEERYKSYDGNSESMIDHFYDKLLSLKFPIHNQYIKDIAHERKMVMIDFVIQYWLNGGKIDFEAYPELL